MCRKLAAKKHKLMAAEAREAWATLQRDRGGQVWMRHEAGKSQPYARASQLALAGKSGVRTYSETVT